MAIKVALIDDNKEIRYIVKEVLEMEEDIELCAEAETLDKARALLSQTRPDVAVVDISIEHNDGGFTLLSEIINLNLPTKVIMFSAHSENIFSEKSLKAGAKGYLCKDKTVRCIVDAIRSVHAGKEFVSTKC